MTKRSKREDQMSYRASTKCFVANEQSSLQPGSSDSHKNPPLKMLRFVHLYGVKELTPTKSMQIGSQACEYRVYWRMLGIMGQRAQLSSPRKSKKGYESSLNYYIIVVTNWQITVPCFHHTKQNRGRRKPVMKGTLLLKIMRQWFGSITRSLFQA